MPSSIFSLLPPQSILPFGHEDRGYHSNWSAYLQSRRSIDYLQDVAFALTNITKTAAAGAAAARTSARRQLEY